MTVSTMRCLCRTAFLWGSLLTLTGCFNRLDTNAIEREIESEIESQSRRLSLSEVRCPRDVYRQAGAYFRCVGQLRPEGQFTINVTQKDNQGSIEWNVPNSGIILNVELVESKIQEDFAQAFAKRAFIDCGAAYRINQPGERFECQVIGGVELDETQITSLFVRIDPEGNLNWHEVREALAPAVAAASEDESEDAAADTASNDSSAASEEAEGSAGESTPNGETAEEDDDD